MTDSTRHAAGQPPTDPTRGRRRASAACVLAALTAALLSIALAAPGAGAAAPTTCKGTIDASIDHEALTVPEDTQCVVALGADVKVSGDVRLQRGASLAVLRDGDAHGTLSVGGNLSIAKDAQLVDAGTLHVTGDVTASESQDLYFYDGAKIGGNLEIDLFTGFVDLAGVSVDGTVSIRHFHPLTERRVGGVTINDSRLGELVLKDNEGMMLFQISDNRIARRLDCIQDRGQLFHFERNTVDGTAVDESACRVS